uniref:Uncharacterized protein n=1 Tax=Zonotrichia albicollis TaxID=44394 RepID=A0A8D2MAF6_ZONAL
MWCLGISEGFSNLKNSTSSSEPRALPTENPLEFFPVAVPGPQVEEELQEQEFLDRCFQEMLEEEERDWFIPARDLPQGMQPDSNGHGADDILVRKIMGKSWENNGKYLGKIMVRSWK